MFSPHYKRFKTQSADGFRYRGIQPSRLENLTDAVFAFSITLLVIASEVPKSFLELETNMYSFIGFICCILLLMGLWNNHSNFFLNYGLTDSTTKVLNYFFLFLLLFYIYPLKFLFSYVGTGIYVTIKLKFGDNSPALKRAIASLQESNMTVEQWKDLLVRFGLGLFFLYLLLALMHVHAFKRKKELELNAYEQYETKTFIQTYLILMAISVVSMAVVLILGGERADLAGFVYLAVPIALPLHRFLRKKYQHRFIG